MLAIRSRGDLRRANSRCSDSKPRTATARAIGAVTARRVSRADFADFIADFPAAEDRVVRYVLGKMRESTARHAAERVWGARERLAQELYDLAKEYGVPGSGGVVRIPITQSELGQLAGVAVSTTERVLKEFRVLGIIATRYGATEVRNMDADLEMIRFSEWKYICPEPLAVWDVAGARPLGSVPECFLRRGVRSGRPGVVTGRSSVFSGYGFSEAGRSVIHEGE